MRPQQVKQLAADPPRVSTGIQWSLDSKHYFVIIYIN